MFPGRLGLAASIFAGIDNQIVTKLFNSPSLPGIEEFRSQLANVTGLQFTNEELEQCGLNVMGVERLINHRLGVRRKDGRVLVPPKEYDPDSAESLTEMVEVGQAGVVRSWTWVTRPREKHPLQKPFAFALIQLDGADTPLLHAVDAGSEAGMKTGMRVRARWAAQPNGSIRDITCFEPE